MPADNTKIDSSPMRRADSRPVTRAIGPAINPPTGFGLALFLSPTRTATAVVTGGTVDKRFIDGRLSLLANIPIAETAPNNSSWIPKYPDDPRYTVHGVRFRYEFWDTRSVQTKIAFPI